MVSLNLVSFPIQRVGDTAFKPGAATENNRN